MTILNECRCYCCLASLPTKARVPMKSSTMKSKHQSLSPVKSSGNVRSTVAKKLIHKPLTNNNVKTSTNTSLSSVRVECQRTVSSMSTENSMIIAKKTVRRSSSSSFNDKSDCVRQRTIERELAHRHD
jgi:hypothetical protein